MPLGPPPYLSIQTRPAGLHRIASNKHVNDNLLKTSSQDRPPRCPSACHHLEDKGSSPRRPSSATTLDEIPPPRGGAGTITTTDETEQGGLATVQMRLPPKLCRVPLGRYRFVSLMFPRYQILQETSTRFSSIHPLYQHATYQRQCSRSYGAYKNYVSVFNYNPQEELEGRGRASQDWGRQWSSRPNHGVR
jgi:hypothetical protein